MAFYLGYPHFPLKHGNSMQLTLTTIICWCIIAISSVLGIAYSCHVFKQKKKIFYLIIIDFIANLVLELAIFSLEASVLRSIIISVSFIVAYMLINYIFVLRLDSLGNSLKIEWSMKYVMIVSMLLCGGILAVGLLNLNRRTSIDVNTVIYISFVLFCISSLLEVYLMLVLFSKIKFMLEYRQQLQSTLRFKIILYSVILILLEASYLFLRLYLKDPKVPENHIRVFSYNFRVFTIVDFYKDLLEDIQINQPDSYVLE